MRQMMVAMVAGLSLLTGCVVDSDATPDDLADQNDGALSTNSSLWGANGEAWRADSRLFDYSFAGYRAGEASIPTVKVTANIRDFGAVGDGKHDDSQAFIDAIAKTASGAILVPAGRYVITKRFAINKGNLVLRGEGPDKTILEMPKSLAQVDGKDLSKLGSPTPYSFGDTYIEVNGKDAGEKLAGVTAGAKRGSKTLSVSTTAGMSVGQWVVLTERDTGNTLIKRLYGDSADPGDDRVGAQAVTFHSRIAAIKGNTITLERPIPADVESRWSPEIRSFKPTVQEVGIEHLTMHFKGSTYPGHFKEQGYNAITFNNVANSWVSDVRFVNADLGVIVNNGCAFDTLTGIVVDTDVNRGGSSGHHALWVSGRSSDVLVTKFDMKKTFVHDLSTEGLATQNVFSSGKGVDLNMDHHRNGPYATLFTDIDVGKGSRPFASGGADGRGAHSAAFSTFWNIRSASKFALPTRDFGPLLTFVGVNTSASAAPDKAWLLDKVAPAALQPADIHEAMRLKRLGK